MSSQTHSVRQSYVQGDIYSATPQKIQLLLVEAAIKNINRCKLFWQDSKFEEALEASHRAQDIVAEMLCALDIQNAPDIAKPLASIYLFIFRRVAESGMLYSEEKLNDALRVLESERETWRLACEKFGSTKTAAGDTRVATSAASKTAVATSAGLDLSAGAKTASPLPPKRPAAAPKGKSGWDA